MKRKLCGPAGFEHAGFKPTFNARSKRFHGDDVGGFLLSICRRNDLWRETPTANTILKPRSEVRSIAIR
jgi:hypothetical protein